MSPPVHRIVAPVEVDPATVGALVEDLAALPAEEVVEVDCSAVEFMDSAGVRALTMAAQRHQAAGGSLRVSQPTRVVRRLLEITALTALIDEGASPS
jgi:anti-sigma B factor antagonist